MTKPAWMRTKVREAWAIAKRLEAENRPNYKGPYKGPTLPNVQPAPRVVYFPNIQLRLVAPKPLTEDERNRGGLDVVTFVTTPNVTKTDMKEFLLKVHGVKVKRLDTVNYDGKKKRNARGTGFYRRPDYKKVYVTLEERWMPPERFQVPEENKT